MGESGDVEDRLEALQTANRRRAAGLKSSFDDIVEAASDVATDDEHDPEGHTIAWERQQVAALIDHATTSHALIAAARRRVEDGTYGICTACRRPISSARLEALPATPWCVACADGRAEQGRT